ncbi:MAG: heme exporter protein CcmB [Planctomycetes bacterium]|nr:heme exporter protein CcmB [Planctomycetota bacterium]NUQ35966.1 heme exporter protein CcmB [Planctomycetaceae bacterium]
MIRTLDLLIRREAAIERRTLGWLASMGLLGVLGVIVLGLGFSPEPSGDVKSALSVAGLWLVFLFAGSVGMSRTFAQERESGALDGVMLLPIDPALLYLAKVMTGMVSLLLALAGMAAAAHIFMHLEVALVFGRLLPLFALAALGYVAAGTVIAAMTSSLRGRDALLAIALFPIVVPLFVLATSASRDVLLGTSLEAVWEELIMLAAFDALYLALGMLSFGKVLEA